MYNKEFYELLRQQTINEIDRFIAKVNELSAPSNYITLRKWLQVQDNLCGYYFTIEDRKSLDLSKLNYMQVKNALVRELRELKYKIEELQIPSENEIVMERGDDPESWIESELYYVQDAMWDVLEEEF